MRPRRLVGAVALVAVAVSGVTGVASAAQLGVAAGSVSVADAAHPCAGPATAEPASPVGGSGRYTAVSVTLPAGCTGDLRLVLTDGSVAVGQGTATAAGGGTVQVPVGVQYRPGAGIGVHAVVSGWPVTPTWSAPRPHVWCDVTDGSGAACTATVTARTTGAGVLYFDVAVTTTSTTWVPWAVTFDFGHAYYPVLPTRLGNSDLDGFSDGDLAWDDTGDINDVVRQSACTDRPLLTVVGNDSGRDAGWVWQGWRRVYLERNNFQEVRVDRERRFSFVVNQTQSGYSDVVSPTCGW